MRSSSTPRGRAAGRNPCRSTHYGIIENGFNIGERQGYQPGERVLLAPPLFWSYGCANAMSAVLTHGGTLVLQARFEAGEAIALIERHRCTALYTLPSITAAIVSHPGFQSGARRQPCAPV